jgi:hypothetical protein
MSARPLPRVARCNGNDSVKRPLANLLTAVSLLLCVAD